MIFWDEWVCPYCKRFAMLDSVTANELAKKQVKRVRILWGNYLKTLDKRSVLAHIIWKREKQCRKFFESYSTLNLEDILSQTLLIKRIMHNKDFSNHGEKIEDEKSAEKLVDLYKKTLRIEEEQIKIESCLSKILYFKKFELDKVTDKELFENFRIFTNERYAELVDSYKQFNIMTEQDAEKLVEKGKLELEELRKGEEKPHPFTKEEFVAKLYDIICTIYFGLLRNRLFLEAFDLRDYKKLLKDPVELIKFVNTFGFGEDGISVCNTAEFLIRAKKFFKKDIIILRKILLFEKENSNIFPLFVRIRHEEYDYVFISHKFSEIAYIFLHAIITKQLFDAETEKRSKKFEEKIQIELENKGFRYFPNVTDKKNPTIEIDGIGVDQNYCLVIESKAKRLPTLIEENKRRYQIVRDLKGVIDGIKFSMKNGKEIKKKVPSLLEKIDYVTQNKELFGIRNENAIKFVGLIVTLNYPWISEYKNVRIITYNRLHHLLQSMKIS